VAAASPHFDEALPLQDPADLSSREDPKPTQTTPRTA
jgi:hypothetical protein